MASDPDDEPVYASDVEGRWVIDEEEYLGLVKILVRARAVVKSYRKIGDGAVRIPPRAASDLQHTLQEFAAVDQARRQPCRLKTT